MRKTVLSRIIVLAAVFCLLISAAAAQQVNLSVYEKIDDAFMTKSPESVKVLLETQRDTSEYPQIEEYVLRKSRGLLISNQLELIQEMTLAIIDNNLDCQDAVNLYVIVERAIDKRDANLAVEKAQAAEAAAYVASVPEERKEQAKKQYSEIENETTGEAVYLNTVASKYYSPFTWNAALLFGDVGIVSDSNRDSEFKVGLGASGSFYFRDDLFSLGLNVYVDDLVISLASETRNDAVVDIIPAISYVPVSEDLFLRTGFTLQQNHGEGFFSPVLGVGGNYAFGALHTASWFVDYYPAHFAPAFNLTFAAAAGANVNLGISRIGSNVLYFTVGLRENILISKTGDVRSRTRVNLGFGVGCND